MDLAQVFAMLLQMGVCGKSDFQSPGGRTLTVIVCPFSAPSSKDDDDTPKKPTTGIPPLNGKKTEI